MDSPARRVLVVGAGVAGLACARTLTRAGCAVEVVERRPPGEQPGAGMYLPGSALRALRLLGLDGEVAQQGETVRRQRFLDRSGRLLLDVDVEEAWRGVGACVGIRRSVLHEVLRKGADDVPVRWGATVRTVTADGRVVRVELDDGSTSEHDLVVGADGVHSTVRRLAFGPDPGGARPLGQLGWRFLAPRPPAVRDWSVLLGPGSAVLALPVDDDHVYCYADVRLGSDGPSAFPADALADFAAPVPELLAGATPGLVAPVEEVHLSRWTAPGVVLVGDAAHATSPNMAQGAAMAMEDALVLAASLRQPGPLQACLLAYERRRRPRTDWVRRQTHRRDHIRQLPASLRNALLRRAGRATFRAQHRLLVGEP